jgi:hypothetical protein
MEIRFVPSYVVASALVDQITIALFMEDQATGVSLFVPGDIGPGTHPVGDLYDLAEAPITARFDPFQDQILDSFESISGTLVLTETGSSFSGSFTFLAVHTPEGSSSVTVDGNFAAIPLGQ